jgi:hypothetical protein
MLPSYSSYGNPKTKEGSAMSNYTQEFEEDYEDEYVPETPKSLRAAANRAKKLEAELNEMRREVAFARAGLPLGDPRLNYFIRGYDGELEPESILMAAYEAGLIEFEDDGEGEYVDVENQEDYEAPELQRQQRVMRASAGAASEDVSEQAALARLEQAMNEGGLESMLDVARQYGIPTTYDAQ